MPKYTAEIVDVTTLRGKLTMKVLYSNGAESFHDTHETTQLQDKNWHQLMIARKLEELNGLPELHKSIPIGKVDIDPKVVLGLSGFDIEKQEYATKLRLFERFVSAVVRGFTTVESGEYKELKKYLTDNFKSEYLDLFNG